MKYESEAKRIIQLVRQYAPDKKAEQRVAEAIATMFEESGTGGVFLAEMVRNSDWRKFVKEM